MLAKRYCQAFPCRNFAERGSAYCGEHRPSREPKSVDPFYVSVRWRRFRDWYLGKHPLCEQCKSEGRLVRADMVDHVIELKDGGAPLSEDNAQSLCFHCHNVKTADVRDKRKNHQEPMLCNRNGRGVAPHDKLT